jgi:hypothetical protein
MASTLSTSHSVDAAHQVDHPLLLHMSGTSSRPVRVVEPHQIVEVLGHHFCRCDLELAFAHQEQPLLAAAAERQHLETPQELAEGERRGVALDLRLQVD